MEQKAGWGLILWLCVTSDPCFTQSACATLIIVHHRARDSVTNGNVYRTRAKYGPDEHSHTNAHTHTMNFKPPRTPKEGDSHS